MKYKITLKGKTYEVEVEQGNAMLLNEYEAYAAPAPQDMYMNPMTAAPVAAPAAATKAAPSTSGFEVSAPLPGTILKVNVAVGQHVKSRDILMVIEAMKMENEVLAPKDGVVKEILTTKGAQVATGDVLVII